MNSQSIEDFIERSSTVPRDLIRLCKIVKEADDLSNRNIGELRENRRTFLGNKKGKGEKNEEFKQKLEKDYKYVIDLSENKLDQLKDLEYMIHAHVKEIDSSIVELDNEFRQMYRCAPNIGGEMQNSNTGGGIQETTYTNGIRKKLMKKSLISNGRAQNLERQRAKSSSTKNNLSTNYSENYSNMNGNKYTNVYEDENTSIQQPEELVLDENAEVYCFCQKGSFGNMVGCDNDRCKFQWFHFDCVGLLVKPEGQWFCPDCRDKLKKKKR
mmetsp:Transcript_8668/g.9027  ORF Transcript_8668/g.9027 Transcript_8668/m.9027 type:complete len:269 (+) Transcript_8668:1-807(+)|eukprot:CAMPEP_0170517030 /NCGR_PEP_ID=MMETSP0209-20121228/3132_1 /TAXON_ID=665100 ORGANISM="Litonotus pictus, Strain P1" /NCGR_SAMPLE_ID=MMETSP0209 /ASSEMBLY_ACC=CAM_ASM_000301 /LENGTH=268 /DNA_ID=CAMNT_0010802165 /DNA_START=1 /DNA_END=807 /DNA_ORIENTATION=+